MSDNGWECVTTILDMIPNINIEDNDRNTILHHLVEKGNKNSVEKFLARADMEGNLNSLINKVNSNNESPLHLAVKNNCQDISQLLINKGANKNIKNKNGEVVSWINNEQSGGGKNIKFWGNRKL